MMFIDYILDWARVRGYAALYGSAHQLNDFMTDTDYAAATDSTAVYCHLITAMENVGGHDRADVAVYFARLCDFDFDPEGLLSVQEELKAISKEFLQCVEQGNAVRYLFTPRWQFGYDDFAENVCWCCLRVTLEDMAGDCVPLAPDAPSYNYDIFCPQSLGTYYGAGGAPNPLYSGNRYFATTAVYAEYTENTAVLLLGNHRPGSWSTVINDIITESKIQQWKQEISYIPGRVMTQETENWLRERIGKRLLSNYFNLGAGKNNILAGDLATHYESKEVTVL